MPSAAPVELDESIRQAIRLRALNSFYFFCKAVMGFGDITPHFHREVCLMLQDETYRHKRIELPRGHLKTSICTIAYPIWRVIRNPNIRILIANATATNAGHFLRMIAGTFESNEFFRWLFPEVIPTDFRKVKWTETELEVRRTRQWPEATIEAIGVGGTAVSRHYDLLIKDDLVNEDHLKTPDQMAKVVDWHRYSLSLWVNPAVGEQIVVGNRWAFNDVMAHLATHEPWFLAYSRAAVEKGEILWPERFSHEALNRILDSQGPRIFSAQYLNNPLADDARAFDVTLLRRFTQIPPSPMSYVCAIDPAIGQRRSGPGSDRTAMVVVGMNADRELYVVDARCGRWGVDEMIDQLFDIVRLWKPRVGIETVVFQKALLWPIREAMRRHRLSFPIQELRPSSNASKEARIGALQEYMHQGALFVREDVPELMKEFVEFPLGAHDDLLDALAYAIQMANPASARTRPVVTSPFQLEAIMQDLYEQHTNEQSDRSGVWSWHRAPQEEIYQGG